MFVDLYICGVEAVFRTKVTEAGSFKHSLPAIVSLAWLFSFVNRRQRVAAKETRASTDSGVLSTMCCVLCIVCNVEVGQRAE
jgi:hypothetical protein